MKIGLIILCRFNSLRLPGKILRKINDKEVLSYIYERLLLSKYASQIVLATSDYEDDDCIEKYCKFKGIPCYRGDKDNVSQRYLDCATHFGFDYAVRINGDNILLDAQLIDTLVDKAVNGNFDFVSNVKERTFPEGISVEVINTNFYHNAIKHFNEFRYNEHVTLYFYEHEIGKYYFHYRSNTSVLPKLSLDTETDLKFITQIISLMKMPHTNYFLEEIIELAKKADTRIHAQ